jgi:hypothetical protein
MPVVSRCRIVFAKLLADAQSNLNAVSGCAEKDKGEEAEFLPFKEGVTGREVKSYSDESFGNSFFMNLNFNAFIKSPRRELLSSINVRFERTARR